MPKDKDLPPKYRAWLKEEVVYIITDKEKAVFLELETDRDRDIFIEAFWKQRDPSPETSENEFKREHYDRIRYANVTFGKGTSTPGWKTDRGRVCIILGKPKTSNSYGGESLNLVPIDLWFYQGEYGHGLPSAFYVLFFQEDGMGDYILYSPIRHGPKELIESYDGDPSKAVNILLRVDHELADVSLSLVPGEQNGLSSMPGMQSEMLLNKILTLPHKRVDDLYAEKLLKYKSFIEVDRSVNYVGNDALLKVIQEDDGRYFVHYAVEPSRLSIAQEGDKYAVHLEIFGRLSDLKDKTVYQFQKDVSLNFDPDEIKEMKAKRFSFQDAFPLIDGQFKFNVLIKNPVSKEFTSYEDEVVVPGSTPRPALGPILLSQSMDDETASNSGFRPFRMGGVQIHPSANRVFAKEGSLLIGFKIPRRGQEMTTAATLDLSFFLEDKKVHSLSRALKDLENPEYCFEKLSLADFDPGMYSVVVTLLDQDQKEVSVAKENFLINTWRSMRPVWSISETIPPLDDPYYSYILGTQLLNSGRFEEAGTLFEEACRKSPDSLEFALGLSQVLFQAKEYQKVQDVLVRFLEKAGQQPQAYDLLGRSCYLQGSYGRAIYYFKKYLSHFGANIEILNLLAESYYGAGELEQARAAWKKSIQIAPEQEDIIKKLDKLDIK